MLQSLFIYHGSILLFSLLLLPSPIAADFHILSAESAIKEGGNRDRVSDRILVASNDYNCNGFNSAHGEGNGTLADSGLASQPEGVMTFVEGVCGSPTLDFWFRSDSYTYDYYQSGGDGTLLGTCYRNDDAPSKTCLWWSFVAI